MCKPSYKTRCYLSQTESLSAAQPLSVPHFPDLKNSQVLVFHAVFLGTKKLCTWCIVQQMQFLFAKEGTDYILCRYH